MQVSSRSFVAVWAKGKVAWITGASAGIGEALAHEMARAGAIVVLSARTESDLARVAREVACVAREVACVAREVARAASEVAETTLVLPLDMRDPGGFEEAVSQVRERFGRLDHLILNAGVSQRGYVAETSAAIDEILMRTNFLGPTALARAALPLLIEGGGRITVISSVLGKYGTVSKASYAASKHALHGFFDSLRYEVEGDGVGVTIACPGVVETDIAKRAIGSDGLPLGEANAYTRPDGMSASQCAHLIARAIKTGREEVTIGGFEAHAVKLKRHFPRLFSWAHRMYTRKKPKWS